MRRPATRLSCASTAAGISLPSLATFFGISSTDEGTADAVAGLLPPRAPVRCNLTWFCKHQLPESCPSMSYTFAGHNDSLDFHQDSASILRPVLQQKCLFVSPLVAEQPTLLTFRELAVGSAQVALSLQRHSLGATIRPWLLNRHGMRRIACTEVPLYPFSFWSGVAT